MGCEARVLVVGGPPSATAAAAARVDDLERRWSRFRDDSELSRLGRHPGVPVVVSPETFGLVERAVVGWQRTGGGFDPTVLDAVVAVGYDRSFELVGDSAEELRPVPVPGCAGVTLDPIVRAVTLPPGVRLDPGGIGKGLAADLVVAELLDAGCAGALVDLGGDLRVAGEAPAGAAGWRIGVEDPFAPGTDLVHVLVADGGLATTSRLWRAWRRAGARVHHVIDPATGGSAASDVAAVTVVAGEAWWAEVLAKAAFVAGARGARQIVASGGATGLVVVGPGAWAGVDGLEDLVA